MKIISAGIYDILLLMLLFLSTGCSRFPVIIDRDPFKDGVTVITDDMWHTVTDSRIDNARVLYYKYIKNSEVSDPIVTFEFVARIDPYYYDYHGESLNPEVFILADNAQFTEKLIVNENLKQDMEVSRIYFSHVKIKTDSWRMLIAKIELTPEIQQAIIKANKYMIRFYLGDNPLALEATPTQLDSVKKFLLARGDLGPKQ